MSNNVYLQGVTRYLIKLCQVRYEAQKVIIVADSTIIPHLKKYMEPYLYELLQSDCIEIWTSDSLDSTHCRHSLTTLFQERMSA